MVARVRSSKRLDADVPALLAELGIQVRRAGPSEARGHCPDPAHRKKPGPGSWQIHVDGPKAGLHVCYSCGFGGGLVSLVAKVRGVDLREAYDWLVDRVGGAIPGTVVPVGFFRKVEPERLDTLLGMPRDALPLFGEVSHEMSPALDYLASRGMTPEMVERFRVHAVHPTARSYGGRVIVPVFVGGRMVDFVARLYVERPSVVPKALSGRRDLGARKELSLWGYDDLDPGVPVVHVVEGIWGAIAMRKAVPNVVAACGSAWSDERTEILSPWADVVLVPDGDPAGAKLERRSSSLRFGHRVRVVDLPPGVQPDHLPPSELVRAVEAARPAAFFEAPVVSVVEWEGKV